MSATRNDQPFSGLSAVEAQQRIAGREVVQGMLLLTGGDRVAADTV